MKEEDNRQHIRRITRHLSEGEQKKKKVDASEGISPKVLSLPQKLIDEKALNSLTL